MSKRNSYMTPEQLINTLTNLLKKKIQYSVMIWGPPGVGKSSVIEQIAKAENIQIIDVRLNQLSPMDLRGVPVPDMGITRWYPPGFLPRDGKGILFLDELNMAPPVMQGLAQQLILDRKLGSYQVPDGWFVWAAGNRKEDRATVFDMPAPLANRFIHINVTADLDSFKKYAYRIGINENIIAFLSFRPSLLHDFHEHQHTWPSPRSWEIANELLKADLRINMAVGTQTAREYEVFVNLSEGLPDINKILQGKSKEIFPNNPSIAFATITALSARTTTVIKLNNAVTWLIEKANIEWVQAFAQDAFPLAKERKIFNKFTKMITKNKILLDFLTEYIELVNYE
jgi:midasin (ATPase involved in ribosome maturation)